MACHFSPSYLYKSSFHHYCVLPDLVFNSTPIFLLLEHLPIVVQARLNDIICLIPGCDTRPTLEGSSEHLLVLQLAPLGSLRQYLDGHTLDWDTYTKMALGVASALAHLHTHIDRDGKTLH